uniref:Uncharacterized protein n=1 Tax=Anguilla anguilla TaxID=7936 RepID=A0A0E9SY91_ANGAN
MANTEEYSKS